MSLNPTAIGQAATPFAQVDGGSVPADIYLRELNSVNPVWNSGNYSAGAAAGSGPILVQTPSRICNDLSGSFDLTTGTGTATGVLIACILNRNYVSGTAQARVAVWYETGSGLTDPLNTQVLVADSASSGGFNIRVVGAALTASSKYRLSYQVIP